ncbi:MAG: sialidase family protein [Thermoplasmata archaeon]
MVMPFHLLSGRRRMLLTIIIAGVLIVAGTALVLRPGGPFLPAPAPATMKYPIPPPNVPVTTRPRDNNEPTIAINPLDPKNMVAGSNDYNTPTGDSWPGFYTTHDGGLTWKEDLIPGYPFGPPSQLTGFRGGGDPVVVADNRGNFYYAGIAFKRAVNPLNPIGFGINLGLANCVFVAKSTDGGDSFPQVVIVWAALENLVRFNDKEWIAVDPNNGNVYLVWAIFTGMMTSRLLFSRSTDGGKSWSLPIVISETTSGEINIQGSAVVVDRDSTIHVTWIDFSSRNVRYARSTDMGQSFSEPINVAPIVPLPSTLPNGNYRTPTMTMLAVDTSDTNTTGSLYVTWADYGAGDADVLLAYSRDHGMSWRGPIRVNNDTEGNGADQFFPAVAVSAEGWVHVGFYDRRTDPNNTLLEYWWAISFDGGESFPINIPMSDSSFNGDWSRTGDNDFIGDYTTLVAEGPVVAGVWCDTREGSETAGDSEIYAAIVEYRTLLKACDLGVKVPWTDVPVKEE